MTGVARPVSRAAIISTFGLSLAGLAISGYLTFTHFAGTQFLACSSTGTIDCAAVTTSAQSAFLGVPVAVLGLVNYVAMTAMNSPWGWHARTYWLHVARLGLAVGAMLFVLWLLGAELLIIGHLCLWCTGVHLITFALLVVLSRVTPAQLGWIRSATNETSPF